MLTEQDYKTVDAMETYGGSFVKALGACFRRADHNNFRKLKETFSEYWDQYTNMSKQ